MLPRTGRRHPRARRHGDISRSRRAGFFGKEEPGLLPHKPPVVSIREGSTGNDARLCAQWWRHGTWHSDTTVGVKVEDVKAGDVLAGPDAPSLVTGPAMRMNDLIPVSSHGDASPTVNARDLHAFLEVGKDFSTWIADRIKQFGFVKDQDYTVCSPDSGSKECGVGRGGHNAKDFNLTLDMAKELSMVQNNERGRQARRYFIECEKRLRATTPAAPVIDMSDPLVLAESFIQAEKGRREALRQRDLFYEKGLILMDSNDELCQQRDAV